MHGRGETFAAKRYTSAPRGIFLPLYPESHSIISTIENGLQTSHGIDDKGPVSFAASPNPIPAMSCPINGH